MIEGLLVLLFIVGLAGGFGMVRAQRSRYARVTSHPTRVRIMNHLRRNPGTSITELCEKTNSKWGTLQHHLHLMNRAGLIRSVATGRHRHLFLGKDEIPREDMERIALLRRGKVMNVVAAVLRKPGAIQKEVASSATLSRRIFRIYMNLLSEHGLIKEQEHSRVRRYYPTRQLTRLLQRMESLAPDGEEMAATVAGPSVRPAPSDDAESV